jgi:hypothetical protein
MSATTIRQIHSILSGAFTAAVRWEWIDRNPAGSAKLPKTRHRSPTSPTPAAVASVIAAARDLQLELLAMYMWLAAVTGARRGELCGLQWADIDLDAGLVHIAFSYLVRAGQKMRKDTKTHQDRHLAIDAITVTVLAERKRHAQALLASADVKLAPTAYVFANDPLGLTPWNPDWVTSWWPSPPGSASMSRRSVITPRASCSLAGSTCAIPPLAWDTAVAARPHCATTPTQCPRSIGALRRTLPSSPHLRQAAELAPQAELLSEASIRSHAPRPAG